MERKYLRGAGALAFKVLRMNPNTLQKEEISKGLDMLFSGSEDGALNAIVKFLKRRALKMTSRVMMKLKIKKLLVEMMN